MKGRTPFALLTAQSVSSLQSPRSGSGQASRASPKPMPGFTRLALGFARLARAADCPGRAARLHSSRSGVAGFTHLSWAGAPVCLHCPRPGRGQPLAALLRSPSLIFPCLAQSVARLHLSRPGPWPRTRFTSWCRLPPPCRCQPLVASPCGLAFSKASFALHDFAVTCLARAAAVAWLIGSVRYHCGSCADPELLSEEKRR